MLSCRRRLSCSAMLMVLAALSAAVEVYDEAAPADLEPDLNYQEVNELDTGPIGRSEEDLPHINDVVLYKLVKALQAHDLAGLRHKSTWLNVGNSMGLSHFPPTIKEAVFKRLPASSGSSKAADRIPLPVIRPQQKWKIKKGKAVGSQMVCYFKLCAFRSPS